MAEVTLTIKSVEGTQRLPLSRPRLTIGRGDSAELCVKDKGLSRLHASINREGDKVWIVDEGSINGSFVNGAMVSAQGTLLVDGDEVQIGDSTTIRVSVSGAARPQSAQQSIGSSLNLRLVGSALLIGAFLVGLAAVIGSRLISTRAESSAAAPDSSEAAPRDVAAARKPNASDDASPSSANASLATEIANSNSSEGTRLQPPAYTPSPESARLLLYKDMSEKERLEFIDREAQNITRRMSNSARSEVFDETVLRVLKGKVDDYAGVTANVIFNRAMQYAPYISRCFNQQDVPPIVGLYIVWIETAYYNYSQENKAHAMGLFQFIPGTARQYGVDPSERTNVQKMAPAAARYMKDRIAQFGDDTKGAALAIANYNRGGTPKDLRKIIDEKFPDRSFWTLLANKEKLDHYFQNENVNYVPRFFAAAIIGENPRVFGVQMNPLSSYVVEPGNK
jgi:hypothetical protein